ncbi:MAG: glycosyltransferase [Desulfovibrionaceae bacterium]|nr:glycosyltransferase [Desulfovibrionaceae bacterium]
MSTFASTQNLKLLDYLPPSANHIVELGCGDGSLGQEFKCLNPNAHYIGFEPRAELLTLAQKQLDQVYGGALEDLDLPRLGIVGPIDCLLIHAARLDLDAWQRLLPRILKKLSPTGQVLFVLENPIYVQHFLALLQGQNQEIAFPLKSLVDALPSLNLHVDLILAEITDLKDFPKDEAFADLTKAYVNFCQNQKLAIYSNIFAKRFLVRTCLSQPPQRFILRTIIGEMITSRVRLTEPNTFIQSSLGVVYKELFRNDKIVLETVAQPKAVIFQRLLFRDSPWAEPFLKSIRDAGYLLVYEMDDNPHIWDTAFALSRGIEFLASHAVQVSTEPLADFVRNFNPHVLLFKNHLRTLPKEKDYTSTYPVTLFFGALNRQADWQSIIDPLNVVLRRYGNKVRVKVIWDLDFFKALDTEAKEFVGRSDNYIIPYEEYTKILHSSDIALLPLGDTPINRMKSDLKFIEAAGHGCVAIASPTVYAQSIRDGRTGFIYNSPLEFMKVLSFLIENPERRHETAAQAYDYVRRHRLLASHYTERLDAYLNLYKELPKLEEEVKARVALWQKKKGPLVADF